MNKNPKEMGEKGRVKENELQRKPKEINGGKNKWKWASNEQRKPKEINGERKGRVNENEPQINGGKKRGK